MDFAEADEGIHCIAAPIRDPEGAVIATIWISAPSRRLPRSMFADSAVSVMGAGEVISARLAMP